MYMQGMDGGLLSKVVKTVVNVANAPTKFVSSNFTPKFLQKFDFAGIAAGAYAPSIKAAAGALAAGAAPDFDGGAYLAANPDVAANKKFNANPWEHYVLYGSNENRRATFTGGLTAVWDKGAYLAANPDVAASKAYGGNNEFRHFVEHGASEGRTAQWKDVQINGVPVPPAGTTTTTTTTTTATPIDPTALANIAGLLAQVAAAYVPAQQQWELIKAQVLAVNQAVVETVASQIALNTALQTNPYIVSLLAASPYLQQRVNSYLPAAQLTPSATTLPAPVSSVYAAPAGSAATLYTSEPGADQSQQTTPTAAGTPATVEPARAGFGGPVGWLLVAGVLGYAWYERSKKKSRVH